MTSIRDAGPGDVPAITAITNALIETTTIEWREEPYDVEERREWLAAKLAGGWPVLVAEVGSAGGGEVVGWAGYGDFRDTARWPGYRYTVEHSVHVRRDHWGRGTGRLLVEALASRAAAAGKRVMVAAVDADNATAVAFHRRVGFVDVGHLPSVGEKFGRRLDLVLLQRELV